jgi:hypothetical protein
LTVFIGGTAGKGKDGGYGNQKMYAFHGESFECFQSEVTTFALQIQN